MLKVVIRMPQPMGLSFASLVNLIIQPTFSMARQLIISTKATKILVPTPAFMTKRNAWQRNTSARMLENIRSRWELLTNGIGYPNQSEQHRARRPSSEDSCKPNSKNKGGKKARTGTVLIPMKSKRIHDRWKVTMTPRRWIPVWWWPTTMEPGLGRHPSTRKTGLFATCILQSFGFVFIWYGYGSGSSILGWISIRIWIQSGFRVFWQKIVKNFQLKKKFFWIKNYILPSSSWRTSKLQKKPSSLKKEKNPALQNMKFLIFF